MSRARSFHAVTAVVVLAALVLQLVLVLQGGRVLDEQEQPALGVRLARLVAYFTIQSNVLVAVAAVTLARDPARDGRGWRVVRLAGVVGIAVTGLVHFVPAAPAARPRGRRLAGRQAAPHGGAGARRRRVGGVRAAPPGDRAVVAWALAWPVAWLP